MISGPLIHRTKILYPRPEKCAGEEDFFFSTEFDVNFVQIQEILSLEITNAQTYTARTNEYAKPRRSFVFYYFLLFFFFV